MSLSLRLREPYRPAFYGDTPFCPPLRRIKKGKIGASADRIRQAAKIVSTKVASLAARQVAIAIGILETDLGTGGSWVCSGGNCTVLEDGEPTYNWGGLVGSGTAGSIDHGDRNPDGSPTHYNFQAFHSMQEGFNAFYGTWSRGDVSGDKPQSAVPHEARVLDAAAQGNAYAVASTMYAHRYFVGVAGDAQARIAAYAKAIVGASKAVAAALGEPELVQYGGGGVVGGGGGGGSTVALAVAGAVVASVVAWAVL